MKMILAAMMVAATLGTTPPVTIVMIDAFPEKKYLNGDCSIDRLNEITCRNEQRSILYNSQDTELDYFKHDFGNGGSIEFDVNLCNLGFGYVASLSAVALPALSSDGIPVQTDGFYYCDALSSDILCP